MTPSLWYLLQLPKRNKTACDSGRQCLILSAISSVQFSFAVMSLCDPMNHSTPGLPVHHQLLEFTQTHVH